MTRVAAFLVLLGAMASATSRAQGPSPASASDGASSEPALLLGSVVAQGTGMELAGARVTLRPDEGRAQPLAAVTDDDGRFVIGNIVAGSYRLAVERNGYVEREYGQVRPNRPGTLLVLTPGQRVEGVVVPMVPTGAITGRVFDENGQPLEGVAVRAMRYVYDDNGARVLETVRTGETNDLGAYRIYWLEPGEYFVSATFNSIRNDLLRPATALREAIPADFGRGGVAQTNFLLPQLERLRQEESSGAEIYVDTYFPGIYDAAQASPITVGPASEMSAIDFAVSPRRAVTVSGRVVGGFSASDGLTTTVALVPRSSVLATTGGRGRGRGGAASRGRDGGFSISGVAPGSYTLVATMRPPGRGGRGGNGGAELSGFANVDVAGQDVGNLVIQVQPAVEITGQLWVDDAASGIDLGDLRVRLEPPRGIPLGSPSARIDDDGSFVLDGVGQTLYRASLVGLPEDYYLVQARLGAADALSNDIQVSSTSPSLEFWVSGSGATLEGAIEPGPDQTFSGARVVVVPRDAARRDLYKLASPDQYGRFSVHGLAPGRYTVFAWEDVPQGAWLDPVFMNQYRDRGSAVDVDPGVQAEARPRLIPAGR